MTDIVEKLLNGFPCLEGTSDHTCRVRDAKSGCLCATAADEIEKLRAALWRVRDKRCEMDMGDLSAEEAVWEADDIARAALGNTENNDG